MEQTRKMLINLTTIESKKMTLEELAIAYQENLNPIYLATAFIKVYNLIINLSNKYYGLNKDDIASLALEKLDYCMRTYNSNNMFSTWYTINLRNKFREETESLNYGKRKVVFFSESYEELLQSGFDLEDKNFNIENIENIINIKKLSKNEILFCNLLSKGYTKKDIIKEMKINEKNYLSYKYKLRKKLTF